MGKARYFDFHFSDWLAGTHGIGMDAIAVYITVIAIAGDRGGQCPNDAAFIAAQMAKPGRRRQGYSAATQRTVVALVELIEAGKLHLSHDGKSLSNERVEIELNKVRERINGATLAGITSGLARKKRGNDPAPKTTSQRPANDQPSIHVLNQINDLGRTSVRNLHIDYDSSLTSIFTDAARDPALNGGSGPRAHQRRSTKERVADLAAIARAKLLRSGQ